MESTPSLSAIHKKGPLCEGFFISAKKSYRAVDPCPFHSINHCSSAA